MTWYAGYMLDQHKILYWHVQGMLKEMEVVRKEVLQKPEVLPILVKQLRLDDPDQQSKAAEMLFCVVGQGAGRDATATKQVRPTASLLHIYGFVTWHSLHAG